jgi:vancomycin permeability regulator SanA
MKRKTLLTFLFAILVILGAASLLVWNGMTDHLGKADIALVLGNKVNPDGSPSPRLKARLDTAISLFQKGYFQRIIVSGGTGKEGFPEGTVMKRYLIASGIPAFAVLVDDHGVDTLTSAHNTASIMRS